MSFITRFLTELWVEYGIGMFFFLLRFFSRIKFVGVDRLGWDDLFSFIAMLLWTADAVMAQFIAHHGSNAVLNEEISAVLTDAQAASIEIGSKLVFAGWITYTSLIWSLKACVLCLYSRLTLGLWQEKFVKVMAIICVLSYIAIICMLLGHCTPIQKNWQSKPYPGDECALNVLSYIVVASLNVFTDAGILAIPLPLIWRVKIPLRRKIIIGLLLSSGIFIIVAALIRVILTATSPSQIGNSTMWTLRETFVCVIAVSAPAIKPLFNKNRWIGSSGENTRTIYGTGEYGGTTGSTRHGGTMGSTRYSGTIKNTHTGRDDSSVIIIQRDAEAGKEWDGNGSVSDVELKHISRNGSEEYIIERQDKQSPLVINVTTAYTLSNGTDDVVASTHEGDREWVGGSAGTIERDSSRGLNMGSWGEKGFSRAEISGGTWKEHNESL